MVLEDGASVTVTQGAADVKTEILPDGTMIITTTSVKTTSTVRETAPVLISSSSTTTPVQSPPLSSSSPSPEAAPEPEPAIQAEPQPVPVQPQPVPAQPEPSPQPQPLAQPVAESAAQAQPAPQESHHEPQNHQEQHQYQQPVPEPSPQPEPRPHQQASTEVQPLQASEPADSQQSKDDSFLLELIVNAAAPPTADLVQQQPQPEPAHSQPEPIQHHQELPPQQGANPAHDQSQQVATYQPEPTNSVAPAEHEHDQQHHSLQYTRPADPVHTEHNSLQQREQHHELPAAAQPQDPADPLDVVEPPHQPTHEPKQPEPSRQPQDHQQPDYSQQQDLGHHQHPEAAASAAAAQEATGPLLYPPAIGIDHVMIYTEKLAASTHFYQHSLAALGGRLLFQGPGVAAFGSSIGLMCVLRELAPGQLHNRQHIAFNSATPEATGLWYQRALEAGGADNGGPGPRPNYGPAYYAAFVFDPDGHNIEVCCQVGYPAPSLAVDHLIIPAQDLQRSKQFYESALQPIGSGNVAFEIPGFVGFAGPSGLFAGIQTVKEGQLVNRQHFAFRTQTPLQVDQWYVACLAAGARDNGPPGPRPQYGPYTYAAFVLDPDGHNIEACCTVAEPPPVSSLVASQQQLEPQPVDPLLAILEQAQLMHRQARLLEFGFDQVANFEGVQQHELVDIGLEPNEAARLFALLAQYLAS